MATTFNDGDRGTEIRRKLNDFGTEMDGNVTAAANSAQAAADSAGEADASATEAEGYKTTLETAFGGVSYLPPVEYAASIEIDSAVKTVEYEGEVYAALPSTVPFTTSGTFEADKFRIINSRMSVMALDSIADLIALPAGLRRTDMRYLVKGYHAGTDVGGGEFYWDAVSTADDNGGTVFEVAGVATGRFVRRFDGAVDVTWFGAKGDGVTDDSQAVQNAIAYLFSTDGNTVFFPDGVFFFGSPVSVTFPNQVYNRGLRLLGTSMPGFVSARPGGSRITGASGIDALFIFDKTTPTSGGGYSFECENIDFDGNERTIGSAILNKVGGAPARPFNVRNSNFTQFDKAICSDISETGLTTGICQVNIEGCNFRGNNYGLYGKGQSAIMDLRFVGNVCEQNALGGVHTETGALTGGVIVSDNLLEGQKDAIILRCGRANGEIVRNYFEANTGHIIRVGCTAPSASTFTVHDNYISSSPGTYASFSGMTLYCRQNFNATGVNLDIASIYGNSVINNSGVVNPYDIGLKRFYLSCASVPMLSTTFSNAESGEYVSATGEVENTPAGQSVITKVEDALGPPMSTSSLAVETGDVFIVIALVRIDSGNPSVEPRLYNGGALLKNTGLTKIGGVADGEWVVGVFQFSEYTQAETVSQPNIIWSVSGGAASFSEAFVYKVNSPSPGYDLYYGMPIIPSRPTAPRSISLIKETNALDNIPTSLFSFDKPPGSTFGHRAGFTGTLRIAMTARTTSATQYLSQGFFLDLNIGCVSSDDIVMDDGGILKLTSVSGGTMAGDIYVSLVNVSNTHAELAVTWDITSGTFNNDTIITAQLIGVNSLASDRSFTISEA